VRQDETGFAEFYRASHQRCLRAVIAGAGRPDLAEDLVAEAFTRALVSWRTVRDHPAPEAWVVRTALNAGTSWWRRHRREVPLGDHDAAVPQRWEPGEFGGEPGSGAGPAVLAALRALPRRQREVIALRIFLDLDIATTARLLEIAPGTVGAALAVSAVLTLTLGAPGAGLRANPGGTAAEADPTGTAGAPGTNVSLAAWSVQADGDGSVTVTLRELADAAQLKQALAANGVPALLHFGGGPCSADHAPRRGPVGLAQVRAAGGHLTLTMTFKVSLWPAGSELYIANGPLGPQPAVIPQGHYQGCA
jgi:DNA-directed RNA polymerase specialized sigma24 family protein